MNSRSDQRPGELFDLRVDVGLDFEQWYRREYRPVLALAVGLTGDLAAAEDLTQEAFAEAHRQWADLAGHPNPAGWIRRVVLNKAASRIRRLKTHRKKQHLLVAREEYTDEIPGHEIWDLVKRLPRRQGQVVVLHYLDDLPIIDIAEILDLSPGAVKSHLHRARKALRKHVGEEQP